MCITKFSPEIRGATDFVGAVRFLHGLGFVSMIRYCALLPIELQIIFSISDMFFQCMLTKSIGDYRRGNEREGESLPQIRVHFPQCFLFRYFNPLFVFRIPPSKVCRQTPFFFFSPFLYFFLIRFQPGLLKILKRPPSLFPPSSLTPNSTSFLPSPLG